MKYISSLDDKLIAAIVADHKNKLEEEGKLSAFEIEEACLAIQDCKVFDIEDAVSHKLYEKVLKASRNEWIL